MKVTKLPSVSMHGVEYERISLETSPGCAPIEAYKAPSESWMLTESGMPLCDNYVFAIEEASRDRARAETHAEYLAARAHAQNKGAL